MNLFFVGISGIGMSGIAGIMNKIGHTVAGSCLEANQNTQQLESMGVKIFIGHTSKNITNEIEYMVVSTSISSTNPEVLMAQKLNIPIIHRSKALAMVMQNFTSICITGCHGKTTVSSMLSSSLDEAENPVNAMIGGIVNRFGYSNWYFNPTATIAVAEADESDKSLVNLTYNIAAITNIELDHIEHYKNGIDEMIETYITFINNYTGINPTLFLCINDPIIKDKLLPKLSHLNNKVNIITYGYEGTNANYTITANKFTQYSIATIMHNGNKYLLKLPLYGKHNALNTLVVFGIMNYLGINIEKVINAITNFIGVQRRFTIVNQNNKLNITVVDDYGHHPTEVKCVLEAAQIYKEKNNHKRIICVFQPHRYTRFAAFYHQFAEAFSKGLQNGDVLFLSNIYPAGEKIEDLEKQGISTNIVEQYVNTINKLGGPGVECIDLNSIQEIFNTNKQNNDLWLFIGAGDISSYASSLQI